MTNCPKKQTNGCFLTTNRGVKLEYRSKIRNFGLI